MSPHIGAGLIGLSVDRDAFDGRLQVRAGGPAGAPLQSAVTSASIIRATEVLPLVPATWIDGYAELRRAEQVQQCADPGQARLDLGFRPALVQQMLDLQQGRDLVRGGNVLGIGRPVRPGS